MLQPADAAPQAAPPQAAPDVGACARAAMPIWSSDDAEREFRAFEVGLTLAGARRISGEKVDCEMRHVRDRCVLQAHMWMWG